ncbi:alginate export family protein [Wenzhouxiangella sp. EGI_FJ10305]|uniref:alginate export family protein n=1 Tax=Wenzhouxiangella sp. EGI_FJ10305 TaxID=3243768 RepID=UPI0035DBAE14
MCSPIRYCLAIALALSGATAAAETDQWQPSLDLRYRLELVDDDRFAEDATASTLRARIGLVSPDWSGWQFGVTAHANRHIGSEDFNSTANSRSAYPVVADPDDENISEAWVGYARPEGFTIRAGRQRLIEDNVRFLGNVGFRQLEQTFDAVTAGFEPGDWRVDLRWIDKAHRIFGPSNPNDLLAEADLNTWMGTLSRPLGENTLAVYAQRIAFDDRAASHRNLGLRLTGPLPGVQTFSYRLEFARQDGIRELDDVDGQNYIHARLAQKLEGWHWFAGHERLGGDGDYSFQTPLATLHAHNGWTDQFLATPADGLVDTYAAAGTQLGQWTALIKLHDFRSDRRSRQYGREYGLMVKRPLVAGLSFEVKAAQFDGDDNRADVQKVWFTLNGNW